MDELLEGILDQEEEKNPEPDSMRFIGEHLLKAAKEEYVSNPEEISYQFSRKIAGMLVEQRYNGKSEMVKEGLAIGLYKGLEILMKKIIK
jgi:hypothetical protein